MSRKLRTTVGSLIALAIGSTSGSAFAHHSFAMFDAHKTIVISGTVQQFQWTNPHTYIQVIQDQTKINWTVECAGLVQLYRIGWREDALRPGDKVSVSVHPLRNGAAGAELLWVQKANGTKLFGSPQGEDRHPSKPASTN